MVAIWAKLVKNHRVVKGIIFKKDERFDVSNFYSYVEAVCTQLKCPTPVVLSKHSEGFAEFNITKFKQIDFVEEITFDQLVLESALDTK